jgi:cytochrome c-type biogenesis protein CcmE
MTRKQKRLTMILGGLSVWGVAAGIMLYALSGTITFFYTPSDLSEQNVAPGQRLRLGGSSRKAAGSGARVR